VFDMPTAINFYRDVEFSGSSEPVELHDAEAMVNTAYEAEHRPPAPDPPRIASPEDTCLFFGCEVPDAAY
jgi:glyoxylase I family protein